MSDAVSPADARMAVMRSLQSLFVEVFSEQLNPDGSPATPAQLEQDEDFASELALEILETLGFDVLSVDADGSMTVRVLLDED